MLSLGLDVFLLSESEGLERIELGVDVVIAWSRGRALVSCWHCQVRATQRDMYAPRLSVLMSSYKETAAYISM